MKDFELLQSIFIAMMVAFFIEIFDALRAFYGFVLNFISPIGEAYSTVTFLLLFCTIICLWVGYQPKIINMKDKYLIKLFRKFGICTLILFFIFSIFAFVRVLFS
jgi:hypothetical protein